MKLWLISQSVNNDCDTYDSAVVAAETEETAQHTHPNRWDWNVYWSGSEWIVSYEHGAIRVFGSSDWTEPKNVSVEYLAEFKGPAGVIVSSFNAG